MKEMVLQERKQNKTICGEMISVSYLIPADDQVAIAIMDEAYLSIDRAREPKEEEEKDADKN